MTTTWISSRALVRWAADRTASHSSPYRRGDDDGTEEADTARPVVRCRVDEATKYSELDADDVRVLINGFRSRMDVFNDKLTAVENSELDADQQQHAQRSSSGRDRHGAAALLTDNRPRPDRVLTDGKTENSKPTKESMSSRLRRLEERTDRVGGTTKAAGNSPLSFRCTAATKNKHGLVNRPKSRVNVPGKKTKAAGNTRLDADSTRVLLNKFKSRLDAIDVKLASIEKSKRGVTENEPGLISQLGSRAKAFGEKMMAAVNLKTDSGTDWLRIDELADSVDRIYESKTGRSIGRGARSNRLVEELRALLSTRVIVSTTMTDAGDTSLQEATPTPRSSARPAAVSDDDVTDVLPSGGMASVRPKIGTRIKSGRRLTSLSSVGDSRRSGQVAVIRSLPSTRYSLEDASTSDDCESKVERCSETRRQ